MQPEKKIKPRKINGWIITKSSIPTNYILRWEANKYLPKRYQIERVRIVGWDRVREFLDHKDITTI